MIPRAETNVRFGRHVQMKKKGHCSIYTILCRRIFKYDTNICELYHFFIKNPFRLIDNGSPL